MRLPPFHNDAPTAAQNDTAVAQGRRRFIRQLGSVGLMAAAAVGTSACRSPGPRADEPFGVHFLHGVASGDPLADGVILWTRVTPQSADEDRNVDVHWEMASDAAMRDTVASGSARTGRQQDYTVKVDARGLRPGMVYYYRFTAGGVQSPQGRTKTLPKDDVAQVKLAVFSCSNYPAGYFNVFADAARHDDVDAALHIGDYIYEYESDGYACGNAQALGRMSEPAHLLVVLDDYRRRYAQYRTDADLQALHAVLPMIAVWDDHEFADDAWNKGSVDHRDARQGPFSLRKAAAMRAYREWMPIRLPDPERPERIYRSFDFGKLVSLHMLDTRMIGRDQQVEMASYYDADKNFDAAKFRAAVCSTERHMMGEEQIAWLEQRVAQSRATWQVLGQQVLMARMEYPLPVAMGDTSCADFACARELSERDPATLSVQQKALLAAPTLPCYLDSWDGYQADREKVFALMRRHDKNMVVLAGDTHNAWASDLRDHAHRQVGVEFAGPSVSSPGMECSHGGENPEAVARMMENVIDTLYYAQTSKRGYMILTATASEARCDWHFVDTVFSHDYTAARERSLCTLPGRDNRRIVEVS